MIAKSAFLAALLLMLVLFGVMNDLHYLIPYKRVIFSRYLWTIVSAAGVLFLNLFAGIYLAARALFLKDTGRKLAHVEKQLRAGDVVARDLADRLDED